MVLFYYKKYSKKSRKKVAKKSQKSRKKVANFDKKM